MKKLKYLMSFKESYTDYLRNAVLKIESSVGHCEGDGGGTVGHCSGYKEEDDGDIEDEALD